MALALRKLRFSRPRALPALVVLGALAVLLALGSWQLDRAGQKRRLATDLERRSSMPVLGAETLVDDPSLRYRSLEVAGHYLAGRDLLLDNQVRGGRAGFLLYTPFTLPGRQELLLVNRGWVAAGPRRSVLPETATPAGRQILEGILDRPPRPGIRLGDSVVVSEGWPLVVLELDPRELGERLGSPVMALSLRIGSDESRGLKAEPPTIEDFKPERHLGYAAQWFGLAIVLVILSLLANIKADSAPDGPHKQ